MAGVTSEFRLRVEGNGDGTSEAIMDSEFTGAMVKGALGKAVERDAKNQLDKSVAKLKELVESEVGA